MIVLEQKIAGQPVHRFRLLRTDTNGLEEGQSFSASWERSAKVYTYLKDGYTVTATNWDKDSNSWVDATEAAKDEGFKRANRAKEAGKTGEKAPASIKPSLSARSADFLKGHADLVKLVSTTGRKNGLDAETKRDFGMQTMEALTHAGFSPKDIQELAIAYLNSIQVHE